MPMLCLDKLSSVHMNTHSQVAIQDISSSKQSEIGEKLPWPLQLLQIKCLGLSQRHLDFEPNPPLSSTYLSLSTVSYTIYKQMCVCVFFSFPLLPCKRHRSDTSSVVKRNTRFVISLFSEQSSYMTGLSAIAPGWQLSPTTKQRVSVKLCCATFAHWHFSACIQTMTVFHSGIIVLLFLSMPCSDGLSGESTSGQNSRNFLQTVHMYRNLLREQLEKKNRLK